MDKHHDSDFEKNHNSKQKGFFSFVFEYNEDKKTKFIKIAQYVTLGFIFYSSFIHIIDKYYPKIDDTYSSIEIIITLLLYCYIYFYSLYYIDRIRCYLSSIFSSSQCIKHDEREISEYEIVTPALLAILSYNPQFQDGISIIAERINEAWNGNEKKQKKKKKSEQQQQQQQPISHTPITSSLYSGNTTPINQLPILQEGFTQPVQQSLQQSIQQMHTPEEVNAPLAANEVVGGSFGSLF